MSLKKQAGYGRWPPKKQDMGDEKNMWDMGEEIEKAKIQGG